MLRDVFSGPDPNIAVFLKILGLCLENGRILGIPDSPLQASLVLCTTLMQPVILELSLGQTPAPGSQMADMCLPKVSRLEP